jgi:hypothetical protein
MMMVVDGAYLARYACDNTFASWHLLDTCFREYGTSSGKYSLAANSPLGTIKWDYFVYPESATCDGPSNNNNQYAAPTPTQCGGGNSFLRAVIVDNIPLSLGPYGGSLYT